MTSIKKKTLQHNTADQNVPLSEMTSSVPRACLNLNPILLLWEKLCTAPISGSIALLLCSVILYRSSTFWASLPPVTWRTNELTMTFLRLSDAHMHLCLHVQRPFLCVFRHFCPEMREELVKTDNWGHFGPQWYLLIHLVCLHALCLSRFRRLAWPNPNNRLI